MLLLVDEAHTLPLRLLEEVRLITNIMCEGQPRVRLVLAGGSQMEERLASPKLESFHQRIAARCYLQSLTRDETIGYVQQQIAQAGGIAEAVFTTAALKAIYTATDGIPRLINQVCDHALMLAAAGGQRQLGPDGIAEAWADLQQLPAPWHESAKSLAATRSAPVEGVIEFGSLGDEAASFEIGALPPTEDATASAEFQLAEIDRGLISLAAGDAGPEFDPYTDAQTEIELVFHNPPDPFGSNWDEEEVVIDRYATLEAASLRRPRVRSQEGQQIGQALEALQEKVAALEAAQPATLPLHAQASAAADPVYADVPVEGTRTRLQALADGLGDDRDIIVVEEAEDSHRPAPPSSRARRQEYRQLFSTLRSR